MEVRHAEAQRRNAELRARVASIQEAREAGRSDLEAAAADVEEWRGKHAAAKAAHDDELEVGV
jgi:hypothetical protein